MTLSNLTYLVSILVFTGGPIIWMARVHRRVVKLARKQILLLVLGLTSMAVVIDMGAILLDWGTFSPNHILNLYLGPMPLEEGIFWLGSNGLGVIATVIMKNFSHYRLKWWEYPLILFGFKQKPNS